MPVLKNPRHEAFARAIFKGLSNPNGKPTNGQLYLQAGYKANGERYQTPTGAVSVAEVAASQLLRKVKILDRVNELQRQAAQRAEESAAKCISELNEVYAIATQGEQINCGAAVSAVMGKAKILGFEKQPGLNPHDIAQAKSMHEIARGLLAQLGCVTPDDDAIQAAIAAHDEMVDKLRLISDRVQGLVLEHEDST